MIGYTIRCYHTVLIYRYVSAQPPSSSFLFGPRTQMIISPNMVIQGCTLPKCQQSLALKKQLKHAKAASGHLMSSACEALWRITFLRLHVFVDVVRRSSQHVDISVSWQPWLCQLPSCLFCFASLWQHVSFSALYQILYAIRSETITSSFNCCKLEKIHSWKTLGLEHPRLAPHLNWQTAQTSHKRTGSETRSQEYNYIKGSQFSAPGIDDARCFVEVKEAFVRSWTYTTCKVDDTCPLIFVYQRAFLNYRPLSG